MKKLAATFIIFTFLLGIQNFSNTAYTASKKNELVHTIEYTTKDKFVLQSTLRYPKQKAEKYTLVVLLHSWGLSSKYWDGLPQELLNNGYAILEVDLRGHGKSSYLENSKPRSYIYLSKTSIQKMPDDVYQILADVYTNYTNLSKKEIIFIGADVGASVSVFTAKEMKITPTAMVFISPQTQFKGFYMPNAFLELGEVPVLAVGSKKDAQTIEQVNTIKKYAQGNFSFLKLLNGGPGMMCVTSNDGSASAIATWIVQNTPSKKNKT